PGPLFESRSDDARKNDGPRSAAAPPPSAPPSRAADTNRAGAGLLGAAPGGARPDPKIVPDWVNDVVPLERPIAIFDLEATGTAPHRDRIGEVSVLKIFPDGRKILRHRRVNPGMPIPREASEVHGIYDRDVANEPEFKLIASSLFELMNDADLGGFGIVQFDLPLLRPESERAGIDFPIDGRRIIDAKALYHLMEPRNLAAAHQFYCGEPFQQAHSAEADTLATYRVLVQQLRRYPELPHDLDELHRLSNPRQADFIA